jgi:peptide/nickel transport system permease protein
MTTLERGNPSLLIGSTIVGALVIVAIFVPPFIRSNPYGIDLNAVLAAPSLRHPLGCDSIGRDVLVRLLWGARVSMGVALTVISVSLVTGSVVGGIAALAGGVFDELLMRSVDVLLAFPGILLAIALAAILGPGIIDLIIALAAIGWTGYARLVRGEILSVRRRDYVVAARSLGAKPSRLFFRHLLPAIAGPVLVQATFGIGGIIVAEAALSFLGLGARPPYPTWGNMIDEGRAFLLVAPHITTAPGLAIGFSVLGFNFLGDGLAAALRSH